VDEPSGRWGRLRAGAGMVRVRTTVGALVVVAVALVVGAVGLVAVLRGSLVGGVQMAAEVRAVDVAATLQASSGPVVLAVGEADELFIQVLDPAWRVVQSSYNVAGRAAVAVPTPGRTVQVDTGLTTGLFVLATAHADSPAGPRIVVVGGSLADAEESVLDVMWALAAGLPVLLLVVAVTTWRVVGRALAPVEAIRAEVAEVSEAQLHRRVPEPRGQDEIGRLAATMNQMLGRLDDSREMRRRFTSDASHELRSPVASIRQHAEVALAHPDRTTVGELAGAVLDESRRVQDLVEDLLVLAAVDEDGLAQVRDPVDLDDLVLAQAQDLRAFGTVEVDTSAVSGGRVRGDAVRLRRVVRNLLDNAARHARSLVAVGLREQGGAVVLWVDDDGAGIPPERRSQVFERFVRLDEARTRDGGGTGLGLAIVAEVVAAHGGTVVAAERPGGGGRIEIRLPVLAD
jgi:signal transduction histidine kinase